MTRNFTRLKKVGWLLLLGLLASCQQYGTHSKTAAYVKTDTAKAVLATFYDEIKGFGTIQATNALDLEAKFDGIVHFENLKGRIKKGTVLYTLNGSEIDLKKDDLQKTLANAQTQYEYFKQYYEAKKLLVEKDYLSRIDFEKAVRDFDNAQNNLNKAQYKLNYFLSMTRYKAPFDGYLDYMQVPQGEDAVVGQLLGTFQNDDHIKLIAPFYGNPNELNMQKISIKINDKTYRGKLMYIEKAVDPSTGGHTLWIALQDSTHQLKSGNYVSFSFLTNKHESVAVPKAALIRQQNNYFVMEVINKKYKRIPVKPGLERNGLIEIKEGLKKGAVVLTKGAFEVFYGNIRESMKVAD
jgi:membrane fusion protein (multidrug efflux system)